MKIYELARDLGVDKEALLFLAQSQGIEAKTIAKELTSSEVDILIVEFEEQGGVEAPPKQEAESRVHDVEKSSITTSETPTFVIPEEKKKRSPFSKFKKNLEGYEKVPKEPASVKAKTVKASRAKGFYRAFCVLVILFFVGLGNSAYQANVQVQKLTEEVNSTTKVLNENQETLSKQEKALDSRLKKLEKQEVSSKEDKKVSTDKKAPTKTPEKAKK